MDGWMGGWMGGKAGLRIAYSNQKTKVFTILIKFEKLLKLLNILLLWTTNCKLFINKRF
jgi:hypothetical protein